MREGGVNGVPLPSGGKDWRVVDAAVAAVGESGLRLPDADAHRGAIFAEPVPDAGGLCKPGIELVECVTAGNESVAVVVFRFRQRTACRARRGWRGGPACRPRPGPGR
jgi:hypothetical protein